MNRSRKIGKILKNQVMPRSRWLLHFISPGVYWEFSKSWPYLSPKNVIFYTSLRKQPTFHDATSVFPAKWRLKKRAKKFILMTHHYPNLGSDSDRLYRVRNLIQPIRRTTQIWVETLWNFCARFSDVIWRGVSGMAGSPCRLWVSGLTRFPGKEIFSLLLSLERQQKRFLKTHFEFAYFSFFLIHLERKR